MVLLYRIGIKVSFKERANTEWSEFVCEKEPAIW